jgi:ABC-type transport system involved in cytochrome c biogenesis permease subunit
MNDKTILPLRQKILLGLTISLGILICIGYNLGLIEQGYLVLYIFFYSIGVSIFLLSSETLVDLDNNRIFYIWLAIGLIQFCVYLLTKDNINFKIYRRSNVDMNSFLNKYLSDATTSSLKTLFLLPINFSIQ